MSEVELDRWSDVAEQIRSVWSEVELIHAWVRKRQGDSEQTEDVIKVRPPWPQCWCGGQPDCLHGGHPTPHPSG